MLAEQATLDSLEKEFKKSSKYRPRTSRESVGGLPAAAFGADYCTDMGLALYEASSAYKNAVQEYNNTVIDIALGVWDWEGHISVPSPKDYYDLTTAAYAVAKTKTTMIIIAGWFKAGDCFYN